MTDNVVIETRPSANHPDRQVLAILVDIGVDFGFTSSGKAINVASSGGWHPIPGHPDLAISFNLIRKKGGGEWRRASK